MPSAAETLRQRREGTWINPDQSSGYVPFGDITSWRPPKWFTRSVMGSIALVLVAVSGNAQEFPANPPKNLALTCKKDEDGIRKLTLDIRSYQNRIQQGKMTFAQTSPDRRNTDLFPYEERQIEMTPEMKDLYERMYASKWLYHPREDLGALIQIREGYVTPDSKVKSAVLASFFVSPQLCYVIRQRN